MSKQTHAKARLEYLRAEIDAERISYGEHYGKPKTKRELAKMLDNAVRLARAATGRN